MFHNKTKQLDSYVTFVTVFIVLKENANVSQLVQPYVARGMTIEQVASTIKNFYIRKLCLSFKKPPNSKHSQHIVKKICHGHRQIQELNYMSLQ